MAREDRMKKYLVLVLFSIITPLHAGEIIWVEVSPRGPSFDSFLQFVKEGIMIVQGGDAIFLRGARIKKTGNRTDVYWIGKLAFSYEAERYSMKVTGSATFKRLQLDDEYHGSTDTLLPIGTFFIRMEHYPDYIPLYSANADYFN